MSPARIRTVTLLAALFALSACADEDTGPAEDTAPDTAEDTSAPEDTTPPPVDEDQDGVSPDDGDCDDQDPDVHPGRREDCDGQDDNCNGTADEGYGDADDDGTADCVDVEECDGVDNDGDGDVDGGFPDADADGTADCVDAEACDGVDNDGDAEVDEGFDADGDGYASCDECDDADATVFPGADEPGDGRDHDCDGLVDDLLWADGDLVVTEVMVNPQEYGDADGEWLEVFNASDRDLDLNGLVLRSGSEAWTVDGGGALPLAPGERFVFGGSELRAWIQLEWDGILLDNAADEIAVLADGLEIDVLAWDEGAAMPDPLGASLVLDPWYTDALDNDEPAAWCAATLPWDGSGEDRGSPGAENEPCTTIDHDLDGHSADAGDCDDADAAIAPGLEDTWYDGVDTDCDGWSDYDADRDGYDAADWGGGDCDDDADTTNPGVDEVCDDLDIDEDCDGLTEDDDPSVTGTTTWYVDADGDGYGEDATTADACVVPDGYAATDDDCDDATEDVSPGAAEVCGNAVDDDCDGGPSGCGWSGELDVDGADATLTGEAAGDGVGDLDVAWVGDVDGDGGDDFVVGAAMANSIAGAAYLVLGAPSGETSLGDADARFLGDSGYGAGSSVAGAGDFDGDGTLDLLVGAYGAADGGSAAGAAYVLDGASRGDVSLSSASTVLVGEDPGDFAGLLVLGLGDLDGDGMAEVAVGASSEDAGGTGAGAVYVAAGGTSGSFDLSGAAAKIVGEDPGDEVGAFGRAAGDLDGDGVGDLLVGACEDDTGASGAGAVYVVLLPVSGNYDLSGADAKLTGEAAQDAACHADAGDVDGDGTLDLVVGASAANRGRYDTGAAYLVLGVPSGTYDLANADARITGESDGDMAGYAVGAGDVDGDDLADVVVGAYLEGTGGRQNGKAYLMLGPVGSGDLSVSDADGTIEGDSGDRLGITLDASGDADADGFADLLLDVPMADTSGTDAGTAVLLLGGTGW